MLNSSGISRLVTDLHRASAQRRRRQEHPNAGLVSPDREQFSESILCYFQLFGRRSVEQLNAIPSLEALCEEISRLLLHPEHSWEALAVESSGTRGDPKRVLHSRTSLESEVESWRQLIPTARRILSLIPSHHLYGLIWTVLWPASLSVPVLDARKWRTQDWAGGLRSGDVIVAVPIQWLRLTREIDLFPPGVVGISSAGALSPMLWEQTSRMGLERMLEIYGSTETGGVGYRESPNAPFRLAAHWHQPLEEIAGQLPDRIEILPGKEFRILGRRDGAVKIAGGLVYPEEVAAWIRSCSEVIDCRVDAVGEQESTSLEAILVTGTTGVARRALRLEIERMLSNRLPAAISCRLRFRKSRPEGVMGKWTRP